MANWSFLLLPLKFEATSIICSLVSSQNSHNRCNLLPYSFPWLSKDPKQLKPFDLLLKTGGNQHLGWDFEISNPLSSNSAKNDETKFNFASVFNWAPKSLISSHSSEFHFIMIPIISADQDLVASWKWYEISRISMCMLVHIELDGLVGWD